jgi:hypothetical protein
LKKRSTTRLGVPILLQSFDLLSSDAPDTDG